MVTKVLAAITCSLVPLFLIISSWAVFTRELNDGDYSVNSGITYLCFEKKGPWFVPWWSITVEKVPGLGKRTLLMPQWNVAGSRPGATFGRMAFQGFGGHFHTRAWWIFVPLVVYETARALLYGFGQGLEVTQISILLVLEVLFLLTQRKLRPYESARFVLTQGSPLVSRESLARFRTWWG